MNPNIYDVNAKGHITLTLELDMEEAEALHKTLGISISHLMQKVGRAEPGTSHYKTAISDLSLISGVQQELLEALAGLDQSINLN